MKVVCINDGIISSKSGKLSLGRRIEKGKIYKVVSISKSSFGDGDCYVLKDVGKKRADRFRKIETEWVEELLKSLNVEEICLN